MGEWLGDGALRAPSWRYRADWIPAYAGMTWPRVMKGTGRGAPVVALSRRLDSRVGGNPVGRLGEGA